MFYFVLSHSNTTLPNTSGKFIQEQTVAKTNSLPEQLPIRPDLMSALAARENSLIVYLIGNLNADSSSTLKELVETFLKRSNSYRSFVFDLSGLESLDEAGGTTLEWVRNQMLERGLRLSFINLNPILQNELLMTYPKSYSDPKNFCYVISAN
jgi:anti-anti-sigma factor